MESTNIVQETQPRNALNLLVAPRLLLKSHNQILNDELTVTRHTEIDLRFAQQNLGTCRKVAAQYCYGMGRHRANQARQILGVRIGSRNDRANADNVKPVLTEVRLYFFVLRTKVIDVVEVRRHPNLAQRLDDYHAAERRKCGRHRTYRCSANAYSHITIP